MSKRKNRQRAKQGWLFRDGRLKRREEVEQEQRERERVNGIVKATNPESLVLRGIPIVRSEVRNNDGQKKGINQ